MAVRGPGPRWSWDQGEDLGVAGSHDAEMAAVEGRDRGEVEALGDGDQAGVDAAEGLVGVPLGQLGDARPVGSGEVFDDGLAVGDRSIERRFGAGPELAVQ